MSLPNPSQEPEAYTRSNSSPKAAHQELKLDRLADLVASGQVRIPTDLSAGLRQTLLTQVSRLRHDRLLRHIANVIASDILSGGDP